MSSLLSLLSLIAASDALPDRFLRLALAAALTLPVLAWLYTGIGEGRREAGRFARWGRLALLGGAVVMPLLLVAAALASPSLKYLLFVPADLVFAGTLTGAWLAGRRAHRLEAWGWRLAAAGMALGLLLGTFAFDGPLPPPGFLRGYHDPARCIVRGVHVSAILLGIAAIVAGRGLRAAARQRRRERETSRGS